MTQEQAAALLDRHGGLVWSLSRKLAGSEAEDLFQETFMRLMNANFPQNESPLNAQTTGERNLLYTICLNTYRSEYAKRKRRSAYNAAMPEHYDAPSPHNTEAAVIHEQEQAAVRAAVDKLPEKYRWPVVMYYFTGWTTAEMAQAAGLREATVRSQLNRGREKLRTLLEEML